MPRPVMLDQLKKKIEEMYSYPLNMFFTQANGEVTVHFQVLYYAGCPDHYALMGVYKMFILR